MKICEKLKKVFRGSVNILPLFTEIEKNNCFSVYTGSDLNNIFRRKPLKIDLIDLSIRAWKTCKRYKACANSRNALFTRSGVNNAH